MTFNQGNLTFKRFYLQTITIYLLVNKYYHAKILATKEEVIIFESQKNKIMSHR